MLWQRTGFWVLGVAVVATAAVFAGCGSSSSSTKTPASSGSTATQPSGGAATETGGAATESSGGAPTESSGAAPTAATTGGQASSGGLPADACTLLTNQEASAIANGSITGHTGNTTKGIFQGGTSVPCGYYGDGTGDYHVELIVTDFGDVSTAQKLMQNRTKLGQALNTYKSVSAGDEAFEYNVGPAESVLIRRGSLVLELDAGSDDFPAAPISAVESAAKTAVGRL